MSEIEEAFAFHLRAARLPLGEREYRFAPPRRWRFDFAWPMRLIAIEVEGGIWTGGAHSRGVGFTRNVEKYNEAALLGWTVLRVTSNMIEDGRALDLAIRALRPMQ